MDFDALRALSVLFTVPLTARAVIPVRAARPRTWRSQP
jgi:hypothetical protein